MNFSQFIAPAAGLASVFSLFPSHRFKGLKIPTEIMRRTAIMWVSDIGLHLLDQKREITPAASIPEQTAGR
jgi:hypothetical protein